uniref:Uncharacterized protein n=1 Tax=Aegilops tauschii subsp. strangulata TaxID=200361 RepID=A0A453D892_AEGTS
PLLLSSSNPALRRSTCSRPGRHGRPEDPSFCQAGLRMGTPQRRRHGLGPLPPLLQPGNYPLGPCTVHFDRVSDRPIHHAPVLFVVCMHSMTCKCDALTDTKAACFSALWIGTLCCAGSQATAAALALLLPRRPRWIIRELANFSVAVAGAGHCMFHGAIYILHPGVYFTLASILFMLGDIICGMTLYLVGEDRGVGQAARTTQPRLVELAA